MTLLYIAPTSKFEVLLEVCRCVVARPVFVNCEFLCECTLRGTRSREGGRTCAERLSEEERGRVERRSRMNE